MVSPTGDGELISVTVDRGWYDEGRRAVLYALTVHREGRPDATAEKRFSDFHSLHGHLRDHFGEAGMAGIPGFPGKKLLGNRDAKLIESRRQHFDRFMQACARSPAIRTHEPFDCFVGDAPHTPALRVHFDPEAGSELRDAGQRCQGSK